jgi:hypothetical protein
MHARRLIAFVLDYSHKLAIVRCVNLKPGRVRNSTIAAVNRLRLFDLFDNDLRAKFAAVMQAYSDSVLITGDSGAIFRLRGTP